MKFKIITISPDTETVTWESETGLVIKTPICSTEHSYRYALKVEKERLDLIEKFKKNGINVPNLK